MFKERQMMHEDIIPGSQMSAFIKVCNVFKEIAQIHRNDFKIVDWSNVTILSMFELVVHHQLYVYNATKSSVYSSIYK